MPADPGAIFAKIDWNYLQQWLGLFRWLHVVAAIFWVGITAYFVVIDHYLKPVEDEVAKAEGATGERHVLHGGFFYFVRGYRDGPRRLPRDLYWSSPWYAYVTWMSGFLLLVVLYYADASSTMVDPTKADISGGDAVLIGLGFLVVGQLVYVLVSRALVRHRRICWVVLAGMISAAAWGLDQIFATRAAYIQTGALMGTWMAANVVFVFIPAHRHQVDRRSVGREMPDDEVARAAQRGGHNTYLALPVLAAMLSGHFVMLSSSDHPVIAFLVILLVGALLRFFFVERHQGRIRWQVVAGAGALLLALFLWIQPDAPTSATTAPKTAASPAKPGSSADTSAPSAQGRQIFSANCGACHTLADAGTHGQVGPNLDAAKPNHDLVVQRVTGGMGVMPSFRSRFSDAQIQAVADYVSKAAGS